MSRNTKVEHLYKCWPLWSAIFGTDLAYVGASVQAADHAVSTMLDTGGLDHMNCIELGAGENSHYSKMLTMLNPNYRVSRDEVTHAGLNLIKPGEVASVYRNDHPYDVVFGFNNLINGLTDLDTYRPMKFADLLAFFGNVSHLLRDGGVAVFDRYPVYTCARDGLLSASETTDEKLIPRSHPLAELLGVGKRGGPLRLSITCTQRYNRTTRVWSRDYRCTLDKQTIVVERPLQVTLWDEAALTEAAEESQFAVYYVNAGAEAHCGVAYAEPMFLEDEYSNAPLSDQECTHLVLVK